MTMGFGARSHALADPCRATASPSRSSARAGWMDRGARVRASPGGAMIAALIRWSVANRVLVLMATAALVLAGCWPCRIRRWTRCPTSERHAGHRPHQLPGKPPQVVEDQVTYPLTTTLLGARREDGARLLDSATPSSTRCSTTIPIRTGRAARRRIPSTRCRHACRPAPPPRWGRTRAASAGSTSTRWSTARGRSDIGQLRAERLVPRSSSRPCPTWPRSPASAAWCASTRWCWTPIACASSASPQGMVMDALPRPTRAPAARWSSWPRPSTWCARAASWLRSTTSAPGAAHAHRRDRRYCLGDVAVVQVGPRCAAALPSSTARARWRAAWW